jgi:hypothetical protein
MGCAGGLFVVLCCEDPITLEIVHAHVHSTIIPILFDLWKVEEVSRNPDLVNAELNLSKDTFLKVHKLKTLSLIRFVLESLLAEHEPISALTLSCRDQETNRTKQANRTKKPMTMFRSGNRPILLTSNSLRSRSRPIDAP